MKLAILMVLYTSLLFHYTLSSSWKKKKDVECVWKVSPSSCDCRGQCPAVFGWKQGTYILNQAIAQPHTLTPMDNVELPIELPCLSLDCGADRKNSHRQQGEHPICMFILPSIKHSQIKCALSWWWAPEKQVLSLQLQHKCVCVCVRMCVPCPCPCVLLQRALFYRPRADICWSSGWSHLQWKWNVEVDAI